MNKKEIDYSKIGQERIITIADLIREIVRRFWIVIVLAILFAVLLGGYKYIKDSRAVSQQEDIQYPADSPADNLSEEEQKEVDNILLVEDNMLEQQRYVDKSILMKIDPYDESIVTLQYYFDIGKYVDTSSENYKSNLLDLYQSYVNNGMLVSDLINRGADLEGQYLAELISCEVQSGITKDNTSEMIVLEERATSFTVKIINEDEESCRKLADQVEGCIEDYQARLNTPVGQHDLVLMNESYSNVVDNKLLTYKLDRVNSIVAMQERIDTLKETLSPEQLDIVESNIEQARTESDREAGELEQDTDTVVSVSKKYVAVGALGGIVLACLFIIISYIMRGTINKAEDLQYLYNIRILGRINFRIKKNIFLSLWNRIIGRPEDSLSIEEQIAFLKANLKLVCEKNQIGKILLSGYEAEQSEYLKDAFSILDQCGVRVEYVKDLFASPEALNKLSEFDNIVFVERIRKSRYTEIVKEIEICAEQDINILGAVVIEA